MRKMLYSLNRYCPSYKTINVEIDEKEVKVKEADPVEENTDEIIN